jgi:hypothetical protein
MSRKIIKWKLSDLTKTIVATLLNKYDFFMVIEGNTGCQPKGSKVLMSDGSWKNIENIENGDEVLSPQNNGKVIFAKVRKCHNWFSKNNYIITDNKGNELYKCSSTHKIPYYEYKNKNIQKNSVYYLNNLKKSVLERKNCFSTFPIKKFYGRKNCEIEPYTLGVYLGDGSFSSIRKNRVDNKGSSGNWLGRQLNISNSKKEVMDEVCKYHPPMKIYTRKVSKMYRFSLNSKLAEQLIKYQLDGKRIGEKFIPKDALLSDLNYRKKLLAGLIDTDGYFDKGCYKITTKSQRMAKDIRELILSLGQQARIRKIVKEIKKISFKGEYFSVSFNLKDLHIPLHVNYKKRDIHKKFLHKYPNTFRIKIKKDRAKRVYGFEVNSKSHNYITDNWIVTGNSGKSTLAFHIASKVAQEFHRLYLLRPDVVEYYYERVGRKMELTEEEWVLKLLKLNEEKKYRFKPQTSLIYTQDELQNFLAGWQGISIPDEMINITFNRDFYSEKQKDIIKMLNMFRDHENLTIACVPQFQNLDNQIKNLTKMKLTVKRRGLAIIHTPNPVIYCKDKWDQATNEKIEREWIMKKITYPNYSKLTTFRGLVRFQPLTKKQEAMYQEIKNMKRNVVLKDEMGINQQESEAKDPFNIFMKLLTNDGIRNGMEMEGYAKGMGITADQLRSKASKQLRRENKPHALSHYFWEKKGKKEVNQEFVKV